MNGVHFIQVGFFVLLVIVPLLIYWYIRRNKLQQISFPYPVLKVFEKTPKSLKTRLIHWPFIIRMIVIVLIIIALARPQFTNLWTKKTTEGIDIMMALDISSSMLALDFKPNRLEASKSVAEEFIQGRPDDRIGLVVFSSESFTQCPLTTDHNVLVNLFGGIKSGMIDDGTAIGLGLSNAVNRLRFSQSKSKVIILLTDGENNTGSIAPITAAEIAKTMGIRVYTIGVGTNGVAKCPVQTNQGVQYVDMNVTIDEPTMRKMAAITGGKYFRATDNAKLHQIYQEIDKLEKSKMKIKENTRYNEAYAPFAMLAALLLMIELLIKMLVLRIIP
jgi:Ca-activated chloride channel family protein